MLPLDTNPAINLNPSLFISKNANVNLKIL